jgi:hypothetical protein
MVVRRENRPLVREWRTLAGCMDMSPAHWLAGHGRLRAAIDSRSIKPGSWIPLPSSWMS